MSTRGFTLIELMVTIAIVAILAAIAAPNIGDQLQNYRVKSAAKNLVTDLNEARADAMTNRNTKTITVPATTGDITWSRSPSGNLPESIAFDSEGSASFDAGGTRVVYEASLNGKTAKVVAYRMRRAELWR